MSTSLCLDLSQGSQISHAIFHIHLSLCSTRRSHLRMHVPKQVISFTPFRKKRKQHSNIRGQNHRDRKKPSLIKGTCKLNPLLFPSIVSFFSFFYFNDTRLSALGPTKVSVDNIQDGQEKRDPKILEKILPKSIKCKVLKDK